MNKMFETLLKPFRKSETKVAPDVLVEAKGLHQRFQHAGEELHVLRGIDLQIPRGQRVVVWGASGAGKSTLLHILGGLKRPSEGSVLYEGEDFYRFPEAKQARFRNERIGFVFQFYHLLPELSALENVMLPAMIRRPKEPRVHLKKEAEALLEKLGLGERLHHRPNALSGGEQQRVAIARALVNRPEIVFCDEPTGNLDSEAGKGILHLIMSLNETEKTTFLIVTHAEEVAQIASQIFRIRDGQLEERT
ncbi:MAG: ABC transporter ATP-binding protein [Candidatus Omnitrophota bacterium]